MVSSIVRGHTSFVRTALGQSHAPFLRPGQGLPGHPPPPHDAISFKPCHYLDSFILRGLSPSPAPPSCGVSPTQAVTTRPAHYSLVPLVVSRTKLVLSESF